MPITPAERRPGGTWTKFKRMWAEKPLIPIGMIVTTGFLVQGLRSMHSGNSRQSQLMMRGRVLAQMATIVTIGVYFGWFVQEPLPPAPQIGGDEPQQPR